MHVLLDTNICIYLIKHNPPEVRHLFEKYHIGDIGISAITIAELEYGVHKSKAKEKIAAPFKLFCYHWNFCLLIMLRHRHMERFEIVLRRKDPQLEAWVC